KDSFSSIPVWVKLANVPSELWTKQGLSYVASALGVPLCMDAATTAGNRLSFARVIEMKASSNFPTSYKVRRRNGTLVEVLVQYAWKPSPCCDYRSRRDLWKDLIYNSHIAASFNKCLKVIEVDDLRSVGHFFTWSNKRAGNFAVNKKLDRALANWHWHNSFSYSMAHF
ncbi:LOW QUALITY PROTEIN: DUF4283 domain-containing protein, partial [Cephalotus follicularis]